MKLAVDLLILLLVWLLVAGRWPWQRRLRPASDGLVAARALLGVPADADRAAILAAHRRVLIAAHPDRGGTAQAVHAADAARDQLLAGLAARERRS